MDRIRELVLHLLQAYAMRAIEPKARQIAYRVKLVGAGAARSGVRTGRLAAIGVTGLLVLIGLMMSGFILVHLAVVGILLASNMAPLGVAILLLILALFYTIVPLIVLMYGLGGGLWRGIEDKSADAVAQSVDDAVNSVFKP